MRSRLRTYAPMRRQSLKVKKAAPDFQAVYRLVNQRSEGRCEVRQMLQLGERCQRRAVEHHHVAKPRRSNHTEALVIHMCRDHHDRCSWPYKRGRLVWLSDRLFTIVYASDKFAARQPKAAP